MIFNRKQMRAIESEFLGINQRNVGYVFPNNPRKNYKLADDKVKAKMILEASGIPCAKTLAVIENIGDIAEVWTTLQDHEALAIKPANGSGGEGIKVLFKRSGRWYSGGERVDLDELQLYMANIIMGFYSLGSSDRILIEECIVPHQCFFSLYPAGVSDLRIIIYKHEVALGMLRVPTDKSDGKANLHQGGIGIGIDLESGLMKKAYDGEKYMSYHPDTKVPIEDVQVPFWEEILQLSLDTAKCFPLKYLGVDIVIDETKGPLIMEVNVRPGLGIQMVNQQGLIPILKGIDKKKRKFLR